MFSCENKLGRSKLWYFQTFGRIRCNCEYLKIENIGDTPVRFLEIFRSPRFEDVSLNQWMALTPHELVQTHLNLNKTVMSSLRKEKWPVVS